MRVPLILQTVVKHGIGNLAAEFNNICVNIMRRIMTEWSGFSALKKIAGKK